MDAGAEEGLAVAEVYGVVVDAVGLDARVVVVEDAELGDVDGGVAVPRPLDVERRVLGGIHLDGGLAEEARPLGLVRVRERLLEEGRDATDAVVCGDT